MAAESKRGCGYRKVGGLYFVGEGISVPCDRLPYKLESCPVCGAGIHFTRSLTEINPLKLFGTHDQQVKVFEGEPGLEGEVTQVLCYDEVRPCWMCDPTEDPAYIMMVGEKYYPTPDDFREESRKLGISKRIPFIPKKFELGKTIIYLAHNKACVSHEPIEEAVTNGVLPGMERDNQMKTIYHLGIFTVFKPLRIEKIYWESDIQNMSEEEKEDLDKRGITPVSIPDGDSDHQ
jgi:hypothetical protein